MDIAVLFFGIGRPMIEQFRPLQNRGLREHGVSAMAGWVEIDPGGPTRGLRLRRFRGRRV